jgi:hypothetical protein
MFSLTPGVLRLTGSTAALVSFAESSAPLHEWAGAEVSVKQVERAAEALGVEIGGRAGKQPDGSVESRDEEISLCAIPYRSPTRRRLKARLLRIRAPTDPLGRAGTPPNDAA